MLVFFLFSNLRRVTKLKFIALRIKALLLAGLFASGNFWCTFLVVNDRNNSMGGYVSKYNTELN